MKRVLVTGVACALWVGAVTAPAASAQTPEHVVVFTIPGITWFDILRAHTPTLDRLVAEGGVGAISVRSASRRTVPERGYLTLGAGNRAYVNADDPNAHLAFPRGAAVEHGVAADALMRRTGAPPEGEIVHLGVPAIDNRQDALSFGTEAGALGSALADAGIARAVVSASDLAVDPGPDELRRAAVLGIVGGAGTVDHGTLDGLLRAAPAAPFGVRTDPRAFTEAAVRSLDRARVVLLEAGETSRAEEFRPMVVPRIGDAYARDAVQRTDELLGAVVDLLGPRDLLIVVTPSGPVHARQEHLTPLVLWGAGVEEGSWLSSPATRRDGLATLTDIGPTVLDALGLDRPLAMTGTPIRPAGDAPADAVRRLDTFEQASTLRERMTPIVTGVFIGLLVVLAALAFVVFLRPPRRGPALSVAAVAYVMLAVPPAVAILRALRPERFGDLGAEGVLWALVGVLAVVAWSVPGPRWAGAVPLLLASSAIHFADVLAGAPLQLNGIFGYSPIVAGRFYGSGNLGFTMLYTSTILGLTAAFELRGREQAPRWFALVVAATVLAVGLPPLGANFGGLLSGVSAAVLAVVLAQRIRVRWGWVALAAAGAAVLTTAVVLFDMSRPAVVQTHIGRFGSRIAEGGLPALWTVLDRKVAANVSLLGVTVWTWVLPIGLAVIVLLLSRPRGILLAVLPQHALLRAGLWGAIAVGVIGYLVNDSGIAIPAMVLAHVVPLLVLLAVETVAPRPVSAAAARTAEAPATSDA